MLGKCNLKLGLNSSQRYIGITLIVIIAIFTLIIFLAYKNRSSNIVFTNETDDSKKRGQVLKELPLTSRRELPPILTHSKLGNRGQLGNQMFQIAAVLSIAKKNKYLAKFPEQLKQLPIYKLFDLSNLSFMSGEEMKLLKLQRLNETCNYEDIILPESGAYDLRGYRQDYRYFIENVQEINNQFTIKSEIIDSARKKLATCGIYNDDFIVIHARYADNKITFELQEHYPIPLFPLFDITSDNYFIAAVNFIRNNSSNNNSNSNSNSTSTPKKIVLCSNNIEQFKKRFRDIFPEIIFSPASNIQEDFAIINMARYAVISISTFSWWARQLLAPKGEVDKTLPNQLISKSIGMSSGGITPVRITVAPYNWFNPNCLTSLLMELPRDGYHYPDWYIFHGRSGKIIRYSVSTNSQECQTSYTTSAHADFKLVKLIRSIL